MAEAQPAPIAPENDRDGDESSGLSAKEEKAVLEEAKRRMKYALDTDQDDRDRAERELAFVWNLENCQWDDDAKKRRSGRPMLTENRNPSFIRQVTNAVRQSRPQVRVLPVDGAGDIYTAQILEGLIRNIEANSRADLAYDQATDLAAQCGRGYWKITTEYQGGGFDQDIVIQAVPDPLSIVDDPDAMMPDKSDRKFAFEVEKVPREEYKDRYGVEPTSWEDAQAALGEYAENWGDEKFVFVANYWRVVTEKQKLYRMTDGQIVPDPKKYVAAFIAASKARVAVDPGAILMMPAVPPQVKDSRDFVKKRVEWFCIDGMRAHSKGEWAGQYIPLVYTTCEQARIQGKWRTKGLTYDGQDLTKANNYLLSAQIENIALTPKVPFIGPKGAFDTDKSKWDNVNQEAYSYIEYDIVDDIDGKPLPPPQRPEGVKANPEISNVRAGVIDGQRSVVGLMGASMGDSGPEVAFKAIEARISRGDTAVFHVMDNLVRAVRYGGMVIVDLIPKVYDSKRMVRIINPDSEPVMVAINQMDANTGKTINFASGKYDVTVSAGPAFETQRQRDNENLVALADKVPAIATAAPDLLAKNLLSGPDADKIVQRVQKMVDPAILGQGPPPQVQQLQQQMQGMQQQMAEMGKAKDFAESELMRQKSVLEREQVKSANDLAKLQGDLEREQLKTQSAQLDVRKKELELMREAIPEPMRPAVGPEGQWTAPEAPEPEDQGPSDAEILAPALAHMGEQIGQGLQAIAVTNQRVEGALVQLAAAQSAPKPKGRKGVTLPDGRKMTIEDL